MDPATIVLWVMALVLLFAVYVGIEQPAWADRPLRYLFKRRKPNTEERYRTTRTLLLKMRRNEFEEWDREYYGLISKHARAMRERDDRVDQLIHEPEPVRKSLEHVGYRLPGFPPVGRLYVGFSPGGMSECVHVGRARVTNLVTSARGMMTNSETISVAATDSDRVAYFAFFSEPHRGVQLSKWFPLTSPRNLSRGDAIYFQPGALRMSRFITEHRYEPFR